MDFRNLTVIWLKFMDGENMELPVFSNTSIRNYL
ncbi:hypothetical protein GFO_0373 [Christiangramia forsetii KT0803]|uniref:Uncharacterized protein n=1 Tax=Christiangramia forsetii (strain DSM 17595 / CGMCC 1.15422 / KT0803) TaxID=411154 RepID=A0LYB3_CHRFK|nr:hypothetical protein GFO_0373 [Christiangramia forsetii KT0803]